MKFTSLSGTFTKTLKTSCLEPEALVLVKYISEANQQITSGKKSERRKLRMISGMAIDIDCYVQISLASSSNS